MSNWKLNEVSFKKERVELQGSRMLIGNGFMGYRGTLDEFRKSQLVALNMAGLFDRNGDNWRESVNAPNPLYTCVFVGDTALNAVEICPKEHTQTLDIAHGIHERMSVFELGGTEYTVKSERFLSMERENVLAVKFSVSTNRDAEITVKTGIDTDIWDISEQHLFFENGAKNGDVNTLNFKTGELGIKLSVFENVCGFEFKGEKDGIDLREKTVSLKAGESFSFTKICGVYWGEGIACANENFSAAVAAGFDTLLAEHTEKWNQIWDNSDVKIGGDEEAQFALRYSIYHLCSIVPRNTDRCGIPARGLSGQVYKGASFWDTEMFMLPFFSFTEPRLAENLVSYRINTLAGAERKAAEYGYDGAFFAWESQETGDDACTLFNITDVFTNRTLRTYFRDRQIHVSADMIYGLWENCLISGDYSILKNGGIELIYKCLLFFYSYSHFKPTKNRYELLNVVGPDEYHERVDNNAFTNRMVKYSAETFIKALAKLKEIDECAHNDFVKANDISWVEDFCNRLYVPTPNGQGVIEQFDGYYKLEDTTLSELKKRVIIPNEYLGCGHGLATTTRILKQADIVMMLNVFRAHYSKEIKKANWDFYEPYTEHGSSLSACAYAIVAASIGDADWAYKYFMKTATIDLTGDTKQYLGSLYIGGTHPAANGGSWETAIFGFGGVSYTDEALDISPSLPTQFSSLSFKLFYKGVRLTVEAENGTVKIIPDKDPANIKVTVYGKEYKF